MNNIINIAKKEFMDNFRNKWVLILSIIFGLIVLVASYFTSGGIGWKDFDVTIQAMMIPVQALIPIIGLILGYAAIIGDIENGSMSVLLAYPVKRKEVIIGKFLGLSSVIVSTILIGFGIAGVIIAINVDNPDYSLYLLFTFSSILLGLSFISLGLMFSSIFKKRATSMATAIFTWFFLMTIWQMIIVGLVFATMRTGNVQTPDWFYTAEVINPIIGYSFITLPDQVSPFWIILSLTLWTLVPLLLSFLIFEKKDI